MSVYLRRRDPDRFALAEVLRPDGRPLAQDRWPGATLHSAFHPHYLGEGTVWQREVRGPAMPLARNSKRMARWMWENSPTPWNPDAFGVRTSLNRSVYGTHPIPLYIVDSSDARCPRAVMRTAVAWGASDQEKAAFLDGEIPWPEHVEPARNQDRGLAIADTYTGIIREWFYVTPDGPGRWRARNGGFSVTSPGLRELARTNWATQLVRGSNAVCGMHNALGFIGIAEVLRGGIEHALAFTTANFARGLSPSWPAKMSDGKAPADQAPHSPTHGQWARVSAGVDPQRDPRTGRPYNPLTRMLIRAGQRYGLVGTDTNAWAHAFNAESGYELAALTGEDPWEDGGLIARTISPEDPERAFDVSDFPWDRTEWAPVDWGRPAVDFSPRPGAYWPHVRKDGS
ncbi:MAG: hypothetical protein Q4E05_11040 [Pseudoclavibacter sp.]|nr:hypothetical protein [Pseudoclavibacter sp.]